MRSGAGGLSRLSGTWWLIAHALLVLLSLGQKNACMDAHRQDQGGSGGLIFFSFSKSALQCEVIPHKQF